MAPLALLSLLYSRRHKRGKLDSSVILLVLDVAFGMRRFGMLNILWRNLPAVINDSSFDYSRASWFCNAGLRLYFSFVSPKYLIHSSVFPSSL